MRQMHHTTKRRRITPRSTSLFLLVFRLNFLRPINRNLSAELILHRSHLLPHTAFNLIETPVTDLARASCVCRVGSAIVVDNNMIVFAFKAPWKLKEVVGKPTNGSFCRDNGIAKFAISHHIARGDTVSSLAVKYSVQVMDIKRLNNMMSDHGIYSRHKLLIPISNPEILIDGTCYIELDNYAKREVAGLYLEGAPEQKPLC